MEVENIYPVTEPVGSEQEAPVSNMEMLSDVFFKERHDAWKSFLFWERCGWPWLSEPSVAKREKSIGRSKTAVDTNSTILYRCMAVYLQRPDQHVSNMKVRYLSTQLMDGVLLLSQNGRLINDLLMFFDRQLKDIQRLREEKCEEMENVRL